MKKGIFTGSFLASVFSFTSQAHSAQHDLSDTPTLAGVDPNIVLTMDDFVAVWPGHL